MSGRGKGGKGLGKGGAKRHRKILRDNIQGITKPAIRRLARRGGVKRISGLIYEETRGVLKVFLENVIRDSVTYTEHAKRKTVTALDVVYALKRQAFSAKPQTTLKNSDRKKLRSKIQERFQLNDDDAKLLVPDVVSSMKIKTYNDENGLVYSAQNNDPLWYTVGKSEDELIPSVYTLFKKPSLLPVITTWSFVIDKISTGADLMAPGIALKSNPSQLPDVKEGELVAIAEHGPNLAPVCVGKTAIPTSRMTLDATGKAVLISHSINDALWLAGSQPKDIPEGGRQDSHFDDIEDEAEGPVETITPQVDNLDVKDDRDYQNVQLSVKEVDDILKNALVHAITTSLKGAELPMQASTLLSAHVLPSRSSRVDPGLTDLKSSSFKKATKFLKAMEKDDFLSFKEQKSNVIITRLNNTHPLVKGWRGHKTLAVAEKQVEKRSKQESLPSETRTGYLVEDVYLAKGVVRDWLAHAGVDPDEYYTSSELRAASNDFIESHNLIHPADHAYVLGKQNDILASALYAKPANQKKGKITYDDVDFVPRQEVTGRLVQHMQPFTRLTNGTNSRLIKGHINNFALQIKQRQGRKVTSHLSGPFKEFELKLDDLANELKVICASSTTTGPMQNNPKELEVIVQGDKIKIIIDLLKSKGIPSRLIEIVPKK
ncbi:hypothetical protein E3Q23_02032 [Wallemia mellicola]|uniref:Histone H4 n=1 Tax=Wallemia mellicola TaxID=1708541 RepID=A0A4T0R0I9_9BASI|nr:hypothetical protein E3Q23_02032 [Wallemia mellicola]TIC27856.1 hypothetical protein E3Q11_02102 [Wallemia mellicola]TIC30501.1 hypothetical protein E3Q10_02052 [Wallemia mellicola]